MGRDCTASYSERVSYPKSATSASVSDAHSSKSSATLHTRFRGSECTSPTKPCRVSIVRARGIASSVSNQPREYAGGISRTQGYDRRRPLTSFAPKSGLDRALVIAHDDRGEPLLKPVDRLPAVGASVDEVPDPEQQVASGATQISRRVRSARLDSPATREISSTRQP